MARPIVASKDTDSISIDLTAETSYAVTLVIKRKGSRYHDHYSHSFGPRDKCGLPSARVFLCGGCGHCDECKPSVTPCHAGKTNINECAECGGGCGGGCSGGCGSCGVEHKHTEPSVTYTATMDGCRATFALDENIHDAPTGYYVADLFVGDAKIKSFTMVVQGSGLSANVSAPAKVC